MKRDIRSLENMPLNIKLLYSGILGAMAGVGGSSNQLKIAALYRIISKIQLPIKMRTHLIGDLVKNDTDFYKISKEIYLDDYLNDQEKNIFRFSLMKDLIIIMKSDYIETNMEKELLRDIQDYFDISDEQFAFFIREYEADRCFFHNNLSNNQFRKIIENTISAGAALGIPLLTLSCNRNLNGSYFLRTISPLGNMRIKRRRNKSLSPLGLTSYVLLGITAYKATKQILSNRKDSKAKLVELVRKDIEELHANTKNIIHHDIEYFVNRTVELKDKNKVELRETLNIVEILQRAAATLETTGAIIL